MGEFITWVSHLIDRVAGAAPWALCDGGEASPAPLGALVAGGSALGCGGGLCGLGGHSAIRGPVGGRFVPKIVVADDNIPWDGAARGRPWLTRAG